MIAVMIFMFILFLAAVPGYAAGEEHNHEHDADSITSETRKDHDDHDEDAAHEDHEGVDDPDGHDDDAAHDDHERVDDPDGHDDEADHEGHDHGEINDEVADHDDHEGETEADDGHDHEGETEDGVIHLTSDAVKMAGIAVSHVEHGSVVRSIELPGEIGFDEDQLAHITPRFEGIVQKANYRIGDHVEAGDVLAVVESNESMNSYNIKAPISGWIIARHITLGEFVSQENSIYILADLSTVWVNLAVYSKDADRVKAGMQVDIAAVGSDLQTQGTIAYVSPIIDISTRSLTARIILQNNGSKWRPGTFVRARITTDDGHEGLLVKRNAVQILDGESVVFVLKGENQFAPVVVRTGDYDAENIIVTAGLEAETEYVSDGAFELKAKIVTSNLDAHAGHGH